MTNIKVAHMTDKQIVTSVKRSLTLAVVFVVASSAQAIQPLEKISTVHDLSYFTHHYYLQPQPKLVNNAIQFVGKSNIAANRKTQATIFMSFSCLFSRYDKPNQKTLLNTWQRTAKTLDEPARSLFTYAFHKKPAELLKAAATSPAKNDMNWACFFATGNEKYLNNIIATLTQLNNRRDINLFMTAASAKWSLSSNAKHHPKVRSTLEALKTNGSAEMQPIAADILNQSPQQIRKETVAILKEQKRKGVW